MSAPYEAHFKKCFWCEAEVPPEEYDKERACCTYCTLQFNSIKEDA